MKVTYVTVYDAKDIRQWSGLGYYIAKSMEDAGMELNYCGPLEVYREKFFRNKKRFVKKILRRNYDYMREPNVAFGFADQINEFISDHPTDIVFCPASIPISLLFIDNPIVFYTDTTFSGVVDFYPEYTGYFRRTKRNAHALEQSAIDLATRIIYSSEWAADQAVDYYFADRQKIDLLPFGANVDFQYSIDEIETMIQKRQENKVVKLLFLALVWDRKGGDIAYQITRQLNESGVKAELQVVGCEAEIPQPKPSWLIEYGFINKNTDEGKKKLDQLMKEAHFLLLPTRADCTPVVFSELNSYGVPSITTNVGGIPLVVKENKNGLLFKQDTDIEMYAAKMKELLEDPDRYRALAISSYHEYQTRLNWPSIGRQIKKILERAVEDYNGQNNGNKK